MTTPTSTTNLSRPDPDGSPAAARPDRLLSDRYERALRLAAAGHRDQRRRLSGVPYIAHPLAVSRIVERAGFDEATAIAALLHDLVEDTATSVAEIQAHFGDEVAATVAGCSEVKQDPDGHPRSWEDRKREHLVLLRDAITAIKAVVLADKLHNMISIRLDLAAGHEVWEAFHASRDRILWYFAAVAEVCGSGDPRLLMLATDYRDELDHLVVLAGGKPDFAPGEA